MWIDDLQARAARLRAADERAPGVTTDRERATLLAERELARTAQAILLRQHARVWEVIGALVDHIGFIRSCDLLPHELEMYERAKALLVERRKGPGWEGSTDEREALGA